MCTESGSLPPWSGVLEGEVKLGPCSDPPICSLLPEQCCLSWFCILGFCRTHSQVNLQPFEGQEDMSQAARATDCPDRFSSEGVVPTLSLWQTICPQGSIKKPPIVPRRTLLTGWFFVLDVMDSITRQNQFYETQVIKQENESGYERRPLEMEQQQAYRPGRNVHMVQLF